MTVPNKIRASDSGNLGLEALGRVSWKCGVVKARDHAAPGPDEASHLGIESAKVA